MGNESAQGKKKKRKLNYEWGEGMVGGKRERTQEWLLHESPTCHAIELFSAGPGLLTVLMGLKGYISQSLFFWGMQSI
jgi:hypothetical protein